VPAGRIRMQEFQKLSDLAERMKKRIVGQDEAVDAVCAAIRRNRVGIGAKKKPVSFIFVGPTGVGKTELVKTLAAELFDTPDALIRLDMSEFMEKHSVSRIIGAPPGYVGYDEAGQLTEKIRRRPYAVILFDEIEKAHPDVMNILLQILDDGRITDAHGKIVNFDSTVIVMTSNAGSDKKSGALGFASSQAALAKDAAVKALSEFLRPDFLNRVDEVITFNPLDQPNFEKITEIMLNDLRKAMENKGLTLIWSPLAITAIVQKAYSVKYGARSLHRVIQRDVEDRIATAMVDNFDKSITKFDVEASDDAIRVDFE